MNFETADKKRSQILFEILQEWLGIVVTVNQSEHKKLCINFPSFPQLPKGHNLNSPEKGASPLRDHLGQTGLQACLWEMFLTLSWGGGAKLTVSRTDPWEVGLSCVRKPVRPEPGRSKQLLPRILLPLPAWVLALTPLKDGLWAARVSQRNPSLL